MTSLPGACRPWRRAQSVWSILSLPARYPDAPLWPAIIDTRPNAGSRLSAVWPVSCLLAVALAPAIALAQNQAPAAQEIVVSAEKLNVETRIDRKIYNVGADLQSDFGTVTDILNNIPSVEVDAEGAVALRGACGPGRDRGDQTEKLEPQPQVVVALGFLMTNCAPSRSSL